MRKLAAGPVASALLLQQAGPLRPDALALERAKPEHLQLPAGK